MRGKLTHEASKRGYDGVQAMVADALAVSPTIGGAAAHIGVAPNALAVWLNKEGLAIVVERKARLVRSDSGFPVEVEGE